MKRRRFLELLGRGTLMAVPGVVTASLVRDLGSPMRPVRLYPVMLPNGAVGCNNQIDGAFIRQYLTEVKVSYETSPEAALRLRVRAG